MAMDSVLFVQVSPLSTTYNPLNCLRQRTYRTNTPVKRTLYSPPNHRIARTQLLQPQSPNSPSPRMAHTPDAHHKSGETKSMPFKAIVNCLHYSLRESTTSIRHRLSYAVYALVPLLLTGALPTLAEDDSTIDPAEVVQNTSGDSTLGRVLGIITLALLVYVSVGAIILTIDNILIRRNDARESDWVRKRVKGLPYPPTQWSPEIDTEFPSRSGSSKTTGLNREQRRIEKKMKEKEAKEKRKKEERAEARKKNTSAETKDS